MGMSKSVSGVAGAVGRSAYIWLEQRRVNGHLVTSAHAGGPVAKDRTVEAEIEKIVGVVG